MRILSASSLDRPCQPSDERWSYHGLALYLSQPINWREERDVVHRTRDYNAKHSLYNRSQSRFALLTLDTAQHSDLCICHQLQLIRETPSPHYPLSPLSTSFITRPDLADKRERLNLTQLMGQTPGISIRDQNGEPSGGWGRKLLDPGHGI